MPDLHDFVREGMGFSAPVRVSRRSIRGSYSAFTSSLVSGRPNHRAAHPDAVERFDALLNVNMPPPARGIRATILCLPYQRY